MFKQAIIIPVWLGMSPGKVASQCCHAALKFGKFEDKRVILRVDSKEARRAIGHATVKLFKMKLVAGIPRG